MVRLSPALLVSAVLALTTSHSSQDGLVSSVSAVQKTFLKKFTYNKQRSGGPVPPSTYTDHKAACADCMRSFPNEKRCYYGGCNLRDPNTQGYGGIIGVGAEWKPPQGRVCFSLDPVSWFTDCGEELYKEAKTAQDVAFACSYNNKLQVLPQQFHADFQAVNTAQRLDKTSDASESCFETIKTEGFKFYDDFSAFDSKHKPLSACCSTVHQFFTCLGDKKEELKADVAGLKELDSTTKDLVTYFSSYCVPLYKYPTKPEFCAAYPTADPCVPLTPCEPCVKAQGHWCPGSKQCLTKDWDGFDHCYQTCEHEAKEKIKAKKRVAVEKKEEAPAIIPKPDWYWEIVHNNVTESLDYLPDPHQAVKQGDPVLFRPDA